MLKLMVNRKQCDQESKEWKEMNKELNAKFKEVDPSGQKEVSEKWMKS